jgi:hypothetical protein
MPRANFTKQQHRDNGGDTRTVHPRAHRKTAYNRSRRALSASHAAGGQAQRLLNSTRARRNKKDIDAHS